MNSIHVLLIEDNEGDILLTIEALKSSKLFTKITVLRDGKAAIDFFSSVDNPASQPDLVLLDINLPKKNGHEVLQFIKSSDRFRSLPVIMLTTSKSDKDILMAYKHNANCYITKPIEIAEFFVAISKIEDFWGNFACIPQRQC